MFLVLSNALLSPLRGCAIVLSYSWGLRPRLYASAASPLRGYRVCCPIAGAPVSAQRLINNPGLAPFRSLQSYFWGTTTSCTVSLEAFLSGS